MVHRRSFLSGLAALSMLLFATRGALAHPNVLGAFPADGSVLEHAPESVLIRFASTVDSRSTRISVTGPAGSSSLTTEGSGGEPLKDLTIPVPDQGRGGYLVRWEIVSTDGEKFSGKLRFLVRK